jgi:hypothetical protein
MMAAFRELPPASRGSGSSGVSFSALARPRWQLDLSIDVPLLPRVDHEPEPALAIRQRLARRELTLPPRLPSTSLVRSDIARTPSRSFAGVPAIGSAYDGCLAVGREHLLIAENFAVAIYAKASGALVSPPTSLAGWFPNRPPRANFVFDPRALYDQYADRWVVLALALTQQLSAGPVEGSWLLLSASEGADPAGGWRSTVVDTFDDRVTPPNWADYPSLGVDERAVYVTYNVRGGVARLLIFAKADLYHAGSPTFFDFPRLENPTGGAADSVQPCHHFGPTAVAHLVNTVEGTGPAQAITLWTASWASGTPTLSSHSIEVNPYVTPPNEAAQLGEKPLAVGGTRVRGAVCRADSVWFAFATAYGTGFDDDAWIAARWCRLDTRAGTLIGQDELAAERAFYVFPALMVDAAGNLTLVASRSALDGHPSLHYGRWPSSGPSTAGELVAGRGPHLRCRGDTPCSQPGARNGWGDYNGIALDPADETTVWVFGGVGHESDKTLWATTIAAL